jgi:Tfp pilus assembly protein PilN
MEALSSYRDGKADSLFLEINKEGYEGALFLRNTVTNTLSGNFQTEDETVQADILMSEMQPLLDALKLSGQPERIQVLFRDRGTRLREVLKSRITHPLTVVNETDPKLKIPGEVSHVPYAAVGGVLESLWPKRKSLNLLSKGRHAVQKTPVALTFILLLCLVALWVLYILAPLQVEEKRIQEIDQQIMQRKEEVRKVEALKKEIENINKEIASIHNFKTRKPMALNILRELTTILPKTAWLTRLRISETKVEMEGYAGSATGILAKLESSPFFTKAEFASPTFRDTRLNSDRFNIKMEIEGVQVEPPKPLKEEENEEE